MTNHRADRRVALRRTLMFFVKVSVIYAVLIVPWPGVLDAYRSCIRSVGGTVFYRVGAAGNVAFESIGVADHKADTRLVIRGRGTSGPGVPMDIDVGFLAYRPTAFTLALIIATPIAWSRRWRALVWGVLLVNLFIIVRLAMPIYAALGSGDPTSYFAPSSSLSGPLNAVMLVLFRAPATSYTVPALIWLLVTFQRHDLAALLSPRKEGGTHAAQRSRST